MKKLYIDYTPNFVRVALTEDGELIDFSVERSSMRELVGNIYKGTVNNVVAGMKAAFVDIGLPRNGYLYIGESLVDNEKICPKRKVPNVKLSQGDMIMCQVIKEQFGNKGARLTTDISIPGYFLVLLPKSEFIGVSRKIEDEERRTYLEQYVATLVPKGMGVIVRSAAITAKDEDLQEEIKRLLQIWEKIEKDYPLATPPKLLFRDAMLLERAIRDTLSEDVDEIIVNEEKIAKLIEGKVGKSKITIYNDIRNIMQEYKVAPQINKLADRRVDLDNGAYIIIDKTEALTAIDVNTGRFVGTHDLEDTVFKTNKAAAVCIAKQLRARNISGIIIVDFIDMTNPEHNKEVMELLDSELKKDRLRASVVSMTGLGLVEITRKKANLPVDNFILEPCTHCSGGYVLSKEHIVIQLRDEMLEFYRKRKPNTLIVRVNPEIKETIFETNIMYNEAKKIWKDKRVYIIADDTLERDKFEITGTNKNLLTLPKSAEMLVY